MKPWYKRVLSWWDELLCYLVTVTGVLVAQFQPQLQAGIDINLRWGQVVFGGFIALIICWSSERSGGLVSPEIKAAGKRRNLGWRLGNAAAHGYGWQMAIPAILNGLNSLYGGPHAG